MKPFSTFPRPRFADINIPMLNEADTCRRFVVPLLQAAGWDAAPHRIDEQRTFTDGRVILSGNRARRGKPKRADYLLRLRPDFAIAVVEAKAEYRTAADGVQQAKDYAGMLGLRFAYSTNGHVLIEIDLGTGREVERADMPTPAELWARLREGWGLADERAAGRLLTPGRPDPAKPLRYYQEIAVSRAVAAIVSGRPRALLNLCTGAGKTQVAFQIAWKVWSAPWNRRGDALRPKILFLADRNVLVDDPKDKDFAPFGEARFKIAGGHVTKARDIYFAIYQAIAEDAAREGLFRAFAPDFFDLVIIDECHRGSARADSGWRAILEHFAPAAQLGMTATPLREDNRDSYRYFGEPLYTYSLAQGIEDGFLAPYRVHRVLTDVDSAGWRPTRDEVDRFGRPVPDDEYGTTDFERVVALRARTRAIARHLSDFLKRTDRFAKTIVFCVDQEHAGEMRAALIEENADLVARHPDYICRVTADEGDIGAGHRAHFQDIDRPTPVILTTSQLLTTGVDAPTCKNVVLARVIGSMSEFKQIIGRGTRLREDYNKLWFNIVDYTGTATAKFADPAFDGVAEAMIVTALDDAPTDDAEDVAPDPADADDATALGAGVPDEAADEGLPRKFYVDGGTVAVVGHLVYDLDPEGRRLQARSVTEWATDGVRALYASPDALRAAWSGTDARHAAIEALAGRGIDLDALAAEAGRPDDDALDVLLHLAFGAPVLTRRERAQRARAAHPDVFARHGADASAVLDALMERYAERGPSELVLPDALRVPPVSGFGNPSEIARRFGGPLPMREAVEALHAVLYAD